MIWDTRVQVHWAAQAAAGVGRTLVPRREDFSNESFTWSPEARALLVESTPRAGIRLRDMTLLCGDDEFAMNGRTLDEGFAFFETRFASRLKRPAEGLPDHPVAHGAVFDVDFDALAELDRIYAAAAIALEDVRRHESGAGPVRCWPHHFDIATLITIRGGGEDAHTIGVGMTPGDEGHREPYYYVTPWPYPREPPTPMLSFGEWNTSGWFGAVLPACEDEGLRAFLREAVTHSRALV